MNNKVKTLKWNKKILKIGRRNKTDKRETHHRGCCCCCCVLYYIWSFSFSSIRCCGALALLKI
jgi:hypothetical protein